VGGPPGVLLAIPEDDSTEPPGLLDLGARVKLQYWTAAEVAAL
jgi:hypothetical protein